MSVIRRHPVLTFFLLAYALCWAAIPWQSFFAPGVLVAALIVVFLTEGVAGLKAMGSRLIRWRVSWIWYALAIAVPLAVKFASIGLNSALGAPVPDIAEFSCLVRPPDGDRDQHRQPPQRAVAGGGQLPRLGPAETADHPHPARCDGADGHRRHHLAHPASS